MPRRKTPKIKQEIEEVVGENEESPAGEEGDGKQDDDDDQPTARKKQKLYPQESLQQALKLVEEGYSLHKASLMCKVPKSTLSRRIRNGPPKKSGQDQSMSKEDEGQLVKYAVFMNDAGVPVTNQWLRETAGRLAELRGKPFKNGAPSSGWLSRFFARHPETPSVITNMRDLENEDEICDSITIGTFFREVEAFLTKLDVLTKPANIYNICEFGYSPSSKKLLKSTDDKFSKLKEKVTLMVCVSADGEWLPTMFTFRTSQPMTSEFYTLGPANALFSYSETGENDDEAYIQYMQHLQPFLNMERPVVIFQDNVREYENLDLVEFCIENGVHVYNFPTEIKNLSEPLDLLSQQIKNILDKKQAEKVRQNCKLNIPEAVKLAMEALNTDIVRSAFEQTGIYPLRKEVITNRMLGLSIEKILGQKTCDEPGNDGDTSEMTTNPTEENDSQSEVVMKREGMADKSTQTLPIQSLPCSVCKNNEVPVHPGIAAGVLDFELASVFISEDDNVTKPATSKPEGSRVFDFSSGNWITHESQVQRLRNKRLGLSSPNDSESERRRKEKDLQRELKRAEKERKTQERKESQQLVHGMVKSRVCVSCGVRPETCHTSVCVICERRFHNQCINEVVSVTVCPLCVTK